MKIYRSPLFWLASGLLTLAAITYSIAYYKRAFPILEQSVTLDRAAAVSQALALASHHGWSPGENSRSVAWLSQDYDLTNFIELEGGGKENLSRLVHDGAIAPSRWDVRLFKEKDAAETTVEFSIHGDFLGFTEKLPDSLLGNELPAEQARTLAEKQAEAMGLSLEGFTLVETKDSRSSSSRLDHTFTYERANPGLKAGRDQRQLIVRGDRFSGYHQGVKIPDDFTRRFAAMRTSNNNLQVISTVATVLFLVVGALIGGFVYLARTGQIAWRGALVLAGIIAAFSGLNSISQEPLSWIGYDTALSASAHQTQFWLAAIIQALGMLAFVPIFAAAESLGRAAFPSHPRLWKVVSPRAAGSRTIFGAVLGAYLLCFGMFAYEVLINIVGVKYLGWWIPSQTIFDPSLLGARIPWVSPFFRSLIAGTSEECLFRAMPLACAVLLGRKFGRPWIWITGVMVLQALIFGSAHSSYPAMPGWVRLMELLIPALTFGALFLRFGLLPGILMHLFYDILCMGLPLSTAQTRGSSTDVTILVILALVPLAWVTVCRIRAGSWEELPGDLRNAAWLPKKKRRTSDADTPAERPLPSALLDEKVLLRIFYLGLVALALWIAALHNNPDIPGLSLRKAAAVDQARALLLKQGAPLTPQWEALPIAHSDSDAERTFVWQTAGLSQFNRLLGDYLPVPGWHIRFVRSQLPLPDRSEEYMIYLTGEGRIQRFDHVLPETREGPSLSKSAALQIAEGELKRIYGVDPSKLSLVSANETRQPKRTDWSFSWKDAGIALGQGEARTTIKLAGDSLSGYERKVFVPEDWTRARTSAANARGVTSAILGFVMFVGIVLALIGTFKNWKSHPFCRGAAFTMGTAIFLIFVAQIFVKLPERSAWMSTNEPFYVQNLRLAASGAVGVLGVAVLVGFLAGIGSNRTKPAMPSRTRAEFLAGLGAGFIILLGEHFAQAIGPHDHPWNAGFEGANTGLPFLSGLWLTMSLIFSSLFSLSVQYSLNTRFRPGLSRTALLVVLGVAFGATENSSSWLSMALFGFVFAVAFVLLDRLVIRSHPSVIIAMVTARMLGKAGAGILIPGQPDSVSDGVAAIVLVCLIGWLLFKTMRPNLPTVASQASPAVPPLLQATSP